MDWEIRDTSLHCAACSKEFAEGEDVFSTLLEQMDTYERRDFCRGCRQQQETSTAFSRWRTKMPRGEQSLNRRVNSEVVLDFFHRLEGEQERRKQCFRYVLALMLMRKKLVKFVGVNRDENGDQLVIQDARSSARYRVFAPALSSEEIAGLTDEVSKILNVQFSPAEDQESGLSMSPPARLPAVGQAGGPPRAPSEGGPSGSQGRPGPQTQGHPEPSRGGIPQQEK